MTFQTRESLIYRGEQRRIRALPLTGCGQPVPDLVGWSSACWRRYVGTWEVQEDYLRLVRLGPPHGEDGPDGLAVMFPGQTGPVEATWFSGEIVPDDVVNPENQSLVGMYTANNRPLQFLWFTLVVHRGKVLLEEANHLKDKVCQTRLTGHADGMFPGPEMAFLHAIQACPEDPTPKLVYADWLEERGDPRGPLLRTEAERLKKEGPRRVWAEWNPRQDIPSGCVPPHDRVWYWRWLAGIPDRTPEDREYRHLREQLGLGRPEE